jgi:hypothetical protein
MRILKPTAIGWFRRGSSQLCPRALLALAGLFQHKIERFPERKELVRLALMSLREIYLKSI